jgi:hypothetical protein
VNGKFQSFIAICRLSCLLFSKPPTNFTLFDRNGGIFSSVFIFHSVRVNDNLLEFAFWFDGWMPLIMMFFSRFPVKLTPSYIKIFSNHQFSQTTFFSFPKNRDSNYSKMFKTKTFHFTSQWQARRESFFDGENHVSEFYLRPQFIC